MHIATITSQGQVTIPAEVRKKLGLKKGDKVNFVIKNGKAEIEHVPDLLELAGTFKTNKKPLTSGEIHDKFAEYMANRKKRPQAKK